MERQQIPKLVFWILVGIFIILVCYFAIPGPFYFKRSLFPLVAVLGIVFFVFGLILIIATYRMKIKGKLKLYYLLTGYSAVGVLVFVLLHNFVYPLFIVLFGEGFLQGGDDPVFFILAVIVCPIVFLIGVIGSIVMLVKKEKLRKEKPRKESGKKSGKILKRKKKDDSS